ncbi:hypothetical protein G7059_01035 [Erysipelothrix sp. HDW6A]|uniref:hypothetical protein n=1 Tax=Erysipelothrix sp. HDW6A TaxID=2714928 RepID=UPI001407A87B|nr:hypothetical protein [Erysipelothrix sp. HDW6A]QIK56523.1 hypothetical protein G7059_01035 [Erysipelothrix sp. HDW6A]
MKTRYKFIRLDPTDRQNLEFLVNNMAEKGWHLSGASYFYLKFDYMPQIKLKYFAVYDHRNLIFDDDDLTLDQSELYEEFDYQKLLSAKLYTDPHLENELFNEQRKIQTTNALGLLLWYVYLVFIKGLTLTNLRTQRFGLELFILASVSLAFTLIKVLTLYIKPRISVFSKIKWNSLHTDLETVLRTLVYQTLLFFALFTGTKETSLLKLSLIYIIMAIFYNILFYFINKSNVESRLKGLFFLLVLALAIIIVRSTLII